VRSSAAPSPPELPLNWYLKVLKNYVGFSGRARRQEYWMFIVFHVLVSIVLAVIEAMTGVFTVGEGLGVLSTLYSLFVLLPSLAVGVRRLHDVNRSGWSFLIGLIPIIGGIVLLVWLASEGNRGDNRFGSDPKAEGSGGVAVAMA
jgi:uncharacterized membrane protein YhaH (DUF805 family)